MTSVACLIATLLLASACPPAFAADDYAPTAGRVDLAPTSLTGGAEIFVYVPNGIDGNAVLTEPIPIVYGDDDFTASSAAELAETSGLAALAKRENSVIAFVNSIGAAWGEADATAYKVYAGGLFAERDNQAGTGTWNAVTNSYSNGKYSGYTGHRYYAIAEGAGADFVSGFLVDDTLDTAYGWGGRSSAMPANVMLFNTSKVPSKGTIAFEYPAIVVNGSAAVNATYASLNKNASRVVTLTSSVTDGFDKNIIASQFGKLISVRRSNVASATNNTAIFDLPVYADLGVDVIQKNVTLGATSRMYLTYLPNSVKDAADGTVPMVLAMHGAGEKAEYFALLSTWPEVGAKEGFIVVSVDNHTSITNDQMVQLLEGVFADYPQIDKSRVYASGFSMGSMHTNNLGTQLTQYFAGMVPMDIMPAPTNTANLIIPTFYIGGQEDPYGSVFPSQTVQGTAGVLGSPNNADRMLNYLFNVNDIRGGSYTYDTSAASPWWGMAFDDVQVIPATHGKGIITINSLKSNNGIVYTKLVDTSYLAHNIFADHIPYAWDFISQFSRNADGSISVAPDKSALTAALDQADELTQGDYTTSSWAALLPKIAAANAVATNAHATADEVSQATEAVRAAIDGLASRGNPAVLDAVVQATDRLNGKLDGYTPESVASLTSSLAAARTVLADADNKTQAELDAATSAVQTALSQLTAKPAVVDKTVLRSVHDGAKAVSNTNGAYTPTSWSTLQAEIGDAARVLDDAAATQSQIDAAVKELSSALAGLKPADSVVSKVKLNQSQLRLVKGKSLTLEEAVYYLGGKAAYSGKVTWKSSNTKVATVSSNGVVKAVKAGTASISVTAKEANTAGNKLSTSIKVTVVSKKPAAKVTKVTASVPKTMKVGQTSYITGTYSSTKATGVKVKYTTSKPNVVLIDAAGRMVAVSKGTDYVKITAGGKTKSYKVTVK